MGRGAGGARGGGAAARQSAAQAAYETAKAAGFPNRAARLLRTAVQNGMVTDSGEVTSIARALGRVAPRTFGGVGQEADAMMRAIHYGSMVGVRREARGGEDLAQALLGEMTPGG